MKSTAVMVILNYNDMKVTQKLTRSVMDHECLERVIVVDNCSTDGSYEYLRNAFGKSEVDVIQAPSNGGYATGNNYGIRYALDHYSPEYIFVANPDVAVSASTLETMIRDMTNHRDYGVMAPLVNQGYNVWRLPGFIGMIESLFLVWFNLDKRHIKKKLAASDNRIEDAGVVEGSFFIIRAKDYLAIEGFDERTFLYAEEEILAYECDRDGFKRVYDPSIYVLHEEHGATKSAFRSDYSRTRLKWTEKEKSLRVMRDIIRADEEKRGSAHVTGEL